MPPEVVAPVAPRVAKPRPAVIAHQPQGVQALIRRYAGQYGLEERLVLAVIHHESGFDSGAVSPEGAMGLMQLMPETAALMGVANAFDARQNIAGGVKFLKMCLNRFGQDVGLALAAYNAGPGNVEKYDGCPPFPETRKFVEAVMAKCYGQDWRQNTSITLPDAAPLAQGAAGKAGVRQNIPQAPGPSQIANLEQESLPLANLRRKGYNLF